MSLSNSTSPLPPSAIPPPPTRGPQPTGDIIADSIQVSNAVSAFAALILTWILRQSAKNITEIPCARNSLLSGIASGAGIGVIRGLSAGMSAERMLPEMIHLQP